MSKKVCKKFIIIGHVQGVWFRASTQEQAIKLDITGWAKNLPDGSVEVLACGTEENLNILHTWLQHGPKNARVEKVVISDVADIDFQRFETK